MSFSFITCALLGASLFATPVAQPAAEAQKAASSAMGAEITGAFTGVLLDRYTQQPLPQATIALMRQDGNQLVAGALTAENGEFRLDRAAFGHYTLHVEVAGYEPLHQQITISAGRDLIDLGNVDLVPLKAPQLAAAEAARPASWAFRP